MSENYADANPIFIEDDELFHEGVLRKSGRYPWGSGENPNQRNKEFLNYVDDLKKKGLTDVQIVEGLGMTTTQLRAARTIAKNQLRAADASTALRLKEKGLSNVAIGDKMGLNESSVRQLLNPAMQAKNDSLTNISNMLKEEVDGKKYLDIGLGTEAHIGIPRQKMLTAVALLEEEGYKKYYLKTPNPSGKETLVLVLGRPDSDFKDLANNKDQIGNVSKYVEDSGRSVLGLRPPINIDSARVEVRYKDDGGEDMDGVIQVRRGVDDLSMGKARYAQVRIAVDGSHYLKGMAMYTDDLPDGVDLRFNTNKNPTGNKLDAMKKMNRLDDGSVDNDNPFGAIVKQLGETDVNGNITKVKSAMNIVNEEGSWDKWNKSLSSQVLSKQPPQLAQRQLDLALKSRKQEFDEIMAMTNPTVRKKLLEDFSDGADAAAVHLKAAALPRQRTQVILPINSIKETEIYAPNFKPGEKVVLIRYPHGGIFEIPELTVNNNQPEAKKFIQNARDAVGINAKVAGRLSGADFDGDTVLVIPNNSRAIKNSPALHQLKGFDPQRAYPAFEGMKPMSPRTKQLKMGDVSNLITDMTIKGASHAEIARAVKHSMVVIDAEKHKLNWKQSQIDNGISELKAKYQGGPTRGASTLISRAEGQKRVDNRKARSAKEGGPIDLATGRKMYSPTGESYVKPEKTVVTKRGVTKVIPEQVVVKGFNSKQLAETDDARTLISKPGKEIERVYADYSNSMKDLANRARLEQVAAKPIPYNKAAKAAYAKEVTSLNAKLALAQSNAPLERRAMLLANTVIDAKRKAVPDMEASQIKKVKAQAQAEARARVGAKKKVIEITQQEWDAIQAGAITGSKLSNILNNSDIEQVKKLANPRLAETMVPAKIARAKVMLQSGHTQADVADALGVPLSTLNSAIEIGEG